MGLLSKACCVGQKPGRGLAAELAGFALDHVLGPVPQLLPLLRMRVACELAGWLATANICCYMRAALTFACGDTGGQAVHVLVTNIDTSIMHGLAGGGSVEAADNPTAGICARLKGAACMFGS